MEFLLETDHLKKYYGKDFEVDPLAMIGWSRIPHFYNSFYVYKYATGCSSAISFSQDILKDGPEKLYQLFDERHQLYLDSCHYHVKNDGTLTDIVNKIVEDID